MLAKGLTEVLGHLEVEVGVLPCDECRVLFTFLSRIVERLFKAALVPAEVYQ